MVSSLFRLAIEEIALDSLIDWSMTNTSGTYSIHLNTSKLDAESAKLYTERTDLNRDIKGGDDLISIGF